MVSRAAAVSALVIGVAACGGTGPGGGGGGGPAPHPYLTGRALLSWGANNAGQLGDGGNTQRLTPGPVPGQDNIRAVAAGGDRSLALLTDGTVWEWGAGHTVPAKVPGLADVVAIAAGGAHALALTSDHRVYAWGSNDSGQLGDNSTSAQPVPVLVNNLTDAVAIAAGRAHSVAIRADLSVVAWGANNKGQLGDGTTTDRLAPVTIPNLSAIEVATSVDTTVAVTASATVVGWGANGSCQLGLNPPPQGVVTTPRCDDSATPLSLGGNVATGGNAIAASTTAVLIRTPQNTVDAIGTLAGFDPACGTGDVPWARGPFVAAPGDVTAITSGPRHSLLMTASGQVFGTGANNAGQLGSGTANIGSCMTQATGLSGATAVAAGDHHSLAAVAGVPSLSPAPPVAFPGTPVGSTSTRAITLTNTGMAPLSLYSFAASGDFQVSSQCPGFHTSLAAGAACSLDVSFTPTAGGPRTGTVTIGHDGRGRILEADLVGTGTQPKLVFVPDVIDFGAQSTGTTSQPPRTVTVRNDGDASLTVNSVAATAGFDVASSDCPGAQVASGGGTCTIQVTFSPVQARQAVGELNVTYDGSRLATMTLRGLGT